MELDTTEEGEHYLHTQYAHPAELCQEEKVEDDCYRNTETSTLCCLCNWSPDEKEECRNKNSAGNVCKDHRGQATDLLEQGNGHKDDNSTKKREGAANIGEDKVSSGIAIESVCHILKYCSIPL